MRDASLTLQPRNVPYACSRCAAHPGARDHFIDTGIDSDFEGTIYICNMCMFDLVNAGNDFISCGSHNSTVAVMKEVHDNIQFELNKKIMQYEDLEEALFELGIDPVGLLRTWREKDGRPREAVVSTDGVELDGAESLSDRVFGDDVIEPNTKLADFDLFR